MRKVFLVHGFEGSPNGGWRPWLMAELQKLDVYGASLVMPTPDAPRLDEWLAEIARHAEGNPDDEVYLVGHSLGAAAIMRYVESTKAAWGIAGAVLVSGPCKKTDNEHINEFVTAPFDYDRIRQRIGRTAVIHGDDDPVVPVSQAVTIAEGLHTRLVLVPEGKHLNGSAGWLALPQCLTALTEMFRRRS